MPYKPKILVIGSINMDMILKTKRIPLPGESFFGENYSYSPGGKGANQGIAAALLGGKVTFVGAVGDDEHGHELKDVLMQANISTEYLIQKENLSSGLAVIMLEQGGDNRILVYSGANMGLGSDDVKKAFDQNYDAVMVQFEIPNDTIIEICQLAKEKNIPVIVDAGPAKDFPLERIKGLEILSPNESEVFAMCGIDIKSVSDAQKAAKVLKQRSECKIVVIKMGGDGAYLHTDDISEMVPVKRKVIAVDTTAAGDCFTAAMTMDYLMEKDIKKAVEYGHLAAGISVTRLGAIPSLPTASEVEKFL